MKSFDENEIYSALYNTEFLVRENLGDFIKNGLDARVEDFFEINNFKNLLNALNKYSKFNQTLSYDKLSLCDALASSIHQENCMILVDLLSGKDEQAVRAIAAKQSGKKADDMMGFEVINEIVKNVEPFMQISSEAMKIIGHYDRAEDNLKDDIQELQHNDDLFEQIFVCYVDSFGTCGNRDLTPEEYSEEYFDGKLEQEQPDLWKKVVESYEDGTESDIYRVNTYFIAKEILDKEIKAGKSLKWILDDHGQLNDFDRQEYIFDKAALKEFGERSSADLIAYEASEITGKDLEIDYFSDYRLPESKKTKSYSR